MGRMTRRTAPKTIKELPPPAAAEAAPVETPETCEDIQPEVRHRKGNGLPPDKFSMICGVCGVECAVHIKNPDDYSNEQIAQLFVDRGGSYNPPRCGFCFRKAQLAAGKYKPRLEPADHQPKVVVVEETAA
jgi:hypothetical protein